MGIIATASIAESREPTSFATLSINLSNSGGARIYFNLYPAPSDTSAFAQNFGKVLGCPSLKLETAPQGDQEDESGDAEEVSTANSEAVSKSKRSLQKYVTINGNCDRFISKDGFLVKGELQVMPLLQLLQPLGAENLRISLSHPQAPNVQFTEDIPPNKQRLNLPKYLAKFILTHHSYQIKTDSKNIPPIQLSYGYHAIDVALIFSPILVVFLVPLGLVLWLRRMTIQSQDADSGWFGFTRTFSWIITGTWLLWLAMITTVNPGEFIDFAFKIDSLTENPFASRNNQGMSLEVLKLGLYFLVPMIVTTIAQALSYPVHQKLRGTEWTRAEVIWQSIIVQASTFLPLSLFLIGLFAIIRAQFQFGIIALTMGFIASIGLKLVSARAQNLTLNALTTGDLRDRTFEMAQKAGVRLMQLYVIPSGKAQMVNAFATSQNTIMLSDDLLKKFSRSEVDAIVAHELGHLKHDHPKRLAQAGMFIFAAAIALNTFVLPQIAPQITPWLTSPIILTLVISLSIFYLSRQFELVADFEAVAISGNAEATIRALTKITRLNLMPMDWGKWQEKLFTHPSTNNRVKAIARQANINPERLEEILRLDDSTDDFYGLPAVISDSEPIFSSSFKTNTILLMFFFLLLTTTLTPIAIALLARTLAFQGFALYFSYAIGFILVPIFYLLIQSQINSFQYGKLKRKLSQRFQLQGIDYDCNSQFISLAPDFRICLYEGFSDWDIGFLVIAPGRITYRGEQATFVLQPNDIIDLSLNRRSPNWWKIPRILIHWQQGEIQGDISIWANGSGTLLDSNVSTIKLYNQLCGWQEQPAPNLEILSELPAIAEVTRVPIATIPKFKELRANLLIYLVLAIALGSVLGLIHLEIGYTLAVVFFNKIVQWIPFWQYRES